MLQLFSSIPTQVGDLLRDVENGRIGLPDLQRPFVWRDNKVRDLLDSMLKGYPIGHVMLWSIPNSYDKASQIGDNKKKYDRPIEVVIDGQQRLTALLAALHGIKVRDKDYQDRYIRIAFNPLTCEVAVWSKGYDNVPWISSISEAFASYASGDLYTFRANYIDALKVAREAKGEEPLTGRDYGKIEENLNRLVALNNYSLPTLQISSQAEEEDVAEIFVRVNSGGQNLTEKDFIDTLLSVYDNAAHEKIDRFCEESRIPKDGTAYNNIMAVDPSHLIRISVGLGFRRARLRYAYRLLRGIDLQTGKQTPEYQEKNLAIFRNALNTATDVNRWHDFLNMVDAAGYKNSFLVASNNVIVFSYVLYLLGRNEYKVPDKDLEKIIKKWVFATTATGFYTRNTESDVEKQFNDLLDVHDANGFVKYLENSIATIFSDDYFKLILPSDLNASVANSPAWFAYLASLNILGTQMLFSTTTMASYFVPGANGIKKSIDKHHIFPKNYLTEIGYTTDRERNQIANFTYIDYGMNIGISDADPAVYVKEFRMTHGEEAYRKTCEENALPLDFETMEYTEFLAKRRQLMAQMVRKAYEKLCE